MKSHRALRGNEVKTTDKLFAPTVEKLPGASPNKLSSETRARAEISYAPYVGEELAKKAAAALSMGHLKEYLQGTETPHGKALAREEDRDAARATQNTIIEQLFKDTRVLQAVYKKAKLRDCRITLDSGEQGIGRKA